ncbi:MAG: hypothetical protein QNJ77_03515 [Acidimicrobiia bacterium]|nr:hypothetical protein [Acidimicrobiia bacterium]
MQDAVLIIASVAVAAGLALIMWRELGSGRVRRKVGVVRDTIEVLLPVVATGGLVWWAWVA